MLARTMPGQTNIHQPVLDELIDHLYGSIDGKACERAAFAIDQHLSSPSGGWTPIKTSIPDEWPNATKFLTDGVRMTKQEGDIQWLCPVCKKGCYVAADIKYIKCPVCGVSIKKIQSGSLAGVD